MFLLQVSILEQELVSTKAELRAATGENEFFVSKLTTSRQELDECTMEKHKLRQQVQQYEKQLNDTTQKYEKQLNDTTHKYEKQLHDTTQKLKDAHADHKKVTEDLCKVSEEKRLLEVRVLPPVNP